MMVINMHSFGIAIILLCYSIGVAALVYKCPLGETFIANKTNIWETAIRMCSHPCNWDWDYDWVTNGCSAHLSTEYLEDYIGNWDACQIHDACYRLSNNRSICDSNFQSNMLTSCEDKNTPCVTNITACRLTARIAYTVVSAVGQRSYLQAKQKYKDYCQTDEQCMFGLLHKNGYCCHPKCTQCGNSGCRNAHQDTFNNWNDLSYDANCCTDYITKQCSLHVAPCKGVSSNGFECIVSLYDAVNFAGKAWGPYPVGDYTKTDLQHKFNNYIKVSSLKVNVAPRTICHVTVYEHDNFEGSFTTKTISNLNADTAQVTEYTYTGCLSSMKVKTVLTNVNAIEGNSLLLWIYMDVVTSIITCVFIFVVCFLIYWWRSKKCNVVNSKVGDVEHEIYEIKWN